jgi:hypothetical protein
MQTNQIPYLNESVLIALKFFQEEKRLKVKLPKDKLILAVGSVNAFNTAKLLLQNQATIFADESNLNKTLDIFNSVIKDKLIKKAVLISASGEKDAVWEINELKKRKIEVTLLTCNPQASTIKLADHYYIFKRLSEPYSYNFSTYFSMLLSVFNEEIKPMINYIKKLNIEKQLKNFSYFTLVLPNIYRPIAEMIKVKDDELFAANSSLRAFSLGQARHAKFIYQSKKEMVISFGENNYFGHKENRLELKLPKIVGPAFVLALSYYIVGLIQKQKPDYFKKSLKDYCLNRGPLPYQSNQSFKTIT